MPVVLGGFLGESLLGFLVSHLTSSSEEGTTSTHFICLVQTHNQQQMHVKHLAHRKC